MKCLRCGAGREWIEEAGQMPPAGGRLRAPLKRPSRAAAGTAALLAANADRARLRKALSTLRARVLMNGTRGRPFREFLWGDVVDICEAALSETEHAP